MIFEKRGRTNPCYSQKMKKVVLLLLGLGTPSFIWAQGTSVSGPPKIDLSQMARLEAPEALTDEILRKQGTMVTPADSVEMNPEAEASFPGGKQNFLLFLNKNRKYSEKTKSLKIKGETVLSMIVDKKGRFPKIYVVQSLHRYLDMEAIRLANLMPAWIPAENRGKKVNSLVTVRIPFDTNVAR
jgi:outer membrane biosynthesis protein TonB